ncbi:hypothetical protein [Geomicrobium sp. JCM 19055]|uniref:LolA family protein n=1 Tax=Geomicrobium sp. JCM 19055 TaxID=1460649 RepID=UPI0005A92476|nr:hypothetical protein [Geomicrobium sp. JCM 19055]
MKKTLMSSLLLGSVCMLLGCQTQFSPQEIVANAAETHQQPDQFYIESKIIYEGEEAINLFEWRNQDYYRINIVESLGQTVTIESPEQSLTYLEDENIALISDNHGEIVDEVHYLNDFYQLDDLYDLDVQLVDEDEWIGRDAYHLLLEGADEQVKLVVDQSTWMILMWERGPLRTEIINFEPNPDFDGVFDFEVPTNAEVLHLDHEQNVLTPEEAQQLFASDVRLLTDDYELWEIYVLSEEEVMLEYFKDQSPYVVMTIGESQNDTVVENNELIDQLELFTTVDVYELPGDTFVLTFEEEGNYYEVFAEDANVTVDDLIAFIESLYSLNEE